MKRWSDSKNLNFSKKYHLIASKESGVFKLNDNVRNVGSAAERKNADRFYIAAEYQNNSLFCSVEK